MCAIVGLDPSFGNSFDPRAEKLYIRLYKCLKVAQSRVSRRQATGKPVTSDLLTLGLGASFCSMSLIKLATASFGISDPFMVTPWTPLLHLHFLAPKGRRRGVPAELGFLLGTEFAVEAIRTTFEKLAGGERACDPGRASNIAARKERYDG